ncbi:MAG TPA: carboxypeptidase regulatory-like domain-containing protein [Terracidiphilus sp.]|nr:carboxypeptidase regulatory-like domain-containing protein [Terracidiphilus sp.]
MFVRVYVGWLFVVFWLAGIASIASAQNAQISGLVSDPQKAAIPRASIEILNLSTQIKTDTKSNGSGLYAAPSLPPGKYRLTVRAPGFETQIINNVTVNVAGKFSFDVVLHPGSVQQSVTVNGNDLEVNTTDGSVSTVIDRQFVENMPLNGRSFQSLLTIIPGVTVVPSTGVGASGEITVNGQRTEANYFTVDGVSANTGASPTANGNEAGFGGSTPGESTLGTTQTMVSVEALQEFRATTSTYAAQYGRTPGGQFEFRTRSGENQWHGGLFEYLRNDTLDANRWFNGYLGQPRSEERQNDFGGTLGGPIWVPHLYNGRDRSFFFFSYEGLRLRSPQPAVALDVPNLWLRANGPDVLRPMLNAFPLPDDSTDTAEGTGLATSTAGYSNPSTLDAYSLRLDHSVNDRFKLFLRLAHTPNDTTSRSSTDLAVVDSSRNSVKTLTLGSTNLLTARLVNEFRFNVTGNDIAYNTQSDAFHGATPFTTENIPGVGESPSNWLRFSLQFGTLPTMALVPISNKQRQINVVDWMSTSIGRHTLRWGIDYRRLTTSEYLPPFCEYGYYYALQQVLANAPQIVYTFKFATNAKPVYQNFSAYVQDDWKVNSRLSLSYGLRWEVNPAPHDVNGNNPYTFTTRDLSKLQIASKDTPLWQTAWTNLAPRLGLAWQAHQTPGHETVVRLGAGLFYDTGNALGSLGYNSSGIFSSASLSGVAFPLDQGTIDQLPPPGIVYPYASSYVGFDPHLALPYTMGWSTAIEQGLGENQSVRIGYVAALGRQQTREKFYYPALLGNPNFTSSGVVSLISNGVSSNYNALQVSWQRRLTRGLQTQSSYTWSHSIDDASTNFQTYKLLRADSDFDIRNNFQAAITYDAPGNFANRFADTSLGHWSLDSRISARSSLPVDVVAGYGVDPATGSTYFIHPDRVPDQPLYVSTADASGKLPPGGRRINCAAFSVAGQSSCGPSALPAGTAEGDAGRNVARGFDAVQVDLALRKEFGLYERLHLQFRAEAFNIFNHPIFGSIYNTVTNGPGRFGYAWNTQDTQLGGLNSLYQTGGPRSLQLALKLHF